MTTVLTNLHDHEGDGVGVSPGGPLEGHRKVHVGDVGVADAHVAAGEERGGLQPREGGRGCGGWWVGARR